MNPADIKAIISALTRLSLTYRQPLNDAEMDTYVQVLAPYGAPAVESAVMAILRDPDAPGWYPRPQEIILRITGSRKTQAISAWLKFRQGITTHAHYTVAFDDPLIHYCAQAFGGWRRLGQCSPVANDKLRDDFLSMYSEAIANPPAPSEIQPRLIGDDEAPEGKAIPLGNRERARAVMRGEIGHALAAVTHRPALAVLKRVAA